MKHGDRKMEDFDPGLLVRDKGFLKSPAGHYYYLAGRKYYRLPEDDVDACATRIRSIRKICQILIFFGCLGSVTYLQNTIGYRGFELLGICGILAMMYALSVLGRIIITRGLKPTNVKLSWEAVSLNKATAFGANNLFLAAILLMACAILMGLNVPVLYHDYKYYNTPAAQPAPQEIQPPHSRETQSTNIEEWKRENNVTQESLDGFASQLGAYTREKATEKEMMKTDSFLTLILYLPFLALTFLVSIWAFFMAMTTRNSAPGSDA